MPDPKFLPVREWCAMTGMSRTGTYNELASGNLKAIKLGNRTLVDVEPGLAWLRSLPTATFRQPKSEA